MTVKSILQVWFPNKALEELRATPDRSPEIFRILIKDIEGLQAGCMTLLGKIQKIEHRVDKLEK